MYVVVARVKAKPGCGRDRERHLIDTAEWVTASERFRKLAKRIADLLDGPAAIEAFDEIAGKL